MGDEECVWASASTAVLEVYPQLSIHINYPLVGFLKDDCIVAEYKKATATAKKCHTRTIMHSETGET